MPLADSLPSISKASNTGTFINIASPREPSEIIDRVIPIDENVPVANNLFEAAQDGGSVTLHDFGANDFPTLSENPAPTESEATDALSSMDHEPTINSAESDFVSADPKTSSVLNIPTPVGMIRTAVATAR